MRLWRNHREGTLGACALLGLTQLLKIVPKCTKTRTFHAEKKTKNFWGGAIPFLGPFSREEGTLFPMPYLSIAPLQVDPVYATGV